MVKPIGIMGGTFDPIHSGHLQTVNQAAEQLGFSEIRLMPCYLPPHKAAPDSSQEHRLAMVQLACEHNQKFVIDTQELDAGETSFTVNTLRNMRKAMPDTPLCFFMGMDSFLAFNQWVEWQSILDLTHIVVSRRGDYPLAPNATMQQVLEERLSQDSAAFERQKAGLVWLADTPSLSIASSDIRAKVAAGQDISALVPDYIASYIQRNGLYKATNNPL